MILDALGPQAASIILTLVAALAAFAVAWGAIRVAYQRVTGAPVPRTRLTLVFDVLAELAVNVPGAANRSLAAGGARLFVSPEQEAIRAERDQLAARVAELTASTEPGRLRPTVVPGELTEGTAESARAPDEASVASRTSPHRIPPGTRGMMVLMVLALGGCPRLPPVSGCSPLSQRCEGDRPQVCSPSRRWHFVGDERCDASPGQRCEVRNAVAGCTR